MECYLDGHDDHRKIAFEEADAVIFDNNAAPTVDNTKTNDAANVLYAFLSQVEEKQSWFFDSGASLHLTQNSSLLSNFKNQADHISVRFGVNQVLPVCGKCSLTLNQKKVSDVFYVPGEEKFVVPWKSKTNLCHIPLFYSINCYVFERENPHSILMQGEQDPHNSLCKLTKPRGLSGAITTSFSPTRLLRSTEVWNIEEPKPDLQTCSVSQAELWHRSMGHANYKKLHLITSKKLVVGISHIRHIKSLCATCLKSKQSRDRIPKHSHTEITCALQLLHSDLCGPFPSESLIKKRYILMFTDDFTRYTWIYFLRIKDEALQQFLGFQSNGGE